MDGIHDLGGMHGFGSVTREADEPVFHAPWEGRVFGLAGLVIAAGILTPDAFRHAIERLDPVVYLTAGYYGRWLAVLEQLADVEAIQRVPRPAGAIRTLDTAPRFAPGERVRARSGHPAGHTRLPRYVRGATGVVERVHPACVFPDTNAHGRGECPQHLYGVGFPGAALWGEDAEPGTSVHVDCFESYLEPA